MRNACQNSSVNVNIVLCVVLCSFRTFEPLFTWMFWVERNKEKKRKQLKMHIHVFVSRLMLFLARIFEQTQQINVNSWLFFPLNGIEILKLLRLNDNGRLGHQCIVHVCVCVIIIIDTFCRQKYTHGTVPFDFPFTPFAASSIWRWWFDSKVWWNWDLCAKRYVIKQSYNVECQQKTSSSSIGNLHDHSNVWM